MYTKTGRGDCAKKIVYTLLVYIFIIIIIHRTSGGRRLLLKRKKPVTDHRRRHLVIVFVVGAHRTWRFSCTRLFGIFEFTTPQRHLRTGVNYELARGAPRTCHTIN